MRFITESGSSYEVKPEQQLIRRISNVNGYAASERQGNNEWRSYYGISNICVGEPVLITWDKATTPLLPGSEEFQTPGTLTSIVVEVINDSGEQSSQSDTGS